MARFAHEGPCGWMTYHAIGAGLHKTGAAWAVGGFLARIQELTPFNNIQPCGGV